VGYAAVCIEICGYPTLRKEREGWGTRRFVALSAQEHRAPFAHYSELVRNARDYGEPGMGLYCQRSAVVLLLSRVTS